MCPGDPVPPELKLISRVLATLRNSATVFTPSFGCAANIRLDDAMIVTSFKSPGLNGIDGYSAGLTVNGVSIVISSV